MFSNKEQIAALQAKLDLYEKIHEEQKEQISKLQDQVSKLQDSVMAAHHPDAYRAVKDDHYAESMPDGLNDISEEERSKLEWESSVRQKYLESIEGPTFDNADDVIALLGQRIGPPQPQPVHENDES